jgi:hypothetical protein
MGNRVTVSIELSHAQASWLYRTVMAELTSKEYDDAEFLQMESVIADVVEAVDDASVASAELMFWAEIDQWSRTMKLSDEQAAELRADAEDAWHAKVGLGSGEMDKQAVYRLARAAALDWENSSKQETR